MKICPKCKSEQIDIAKFCGECGANLSEEIEEVKETISAKDGTAFNKEEFDSTLYYSTEDYYVKKIVDEEMKKGNNSFSKTLPSIEIRKSIMTIIYGLLFILFMTLYAFYHVFLVGFFFLFIILTVIYIVQLLKYNLKSYILKDVKSRPDEKISNIVASTISGASNSKVIFIICRIVILIICFMIPLHCFKEAHMIYEKQGNDYVIRYYTLGLYGQDDKIVIPSKYKGKKVVGIRGDVFKNINGLYEVVLPDTLEEIRGGAFKNCYNLEKINIPKSVKRIGGEAFYSCDSLASIELPEGLDEIHGSTFENCRSLESINIPDSVTRIGGHAFRSCGNLKEVKLTEKSQLREIGSSAFRECYNLYEITLPMGVSIDERTFKDSPTNIKYFSAENSWLTEKYAHNIKHEFGENEEYILETSDEKYRIVYYGDLPSMYQFKIYSGDNNISMYSSIQKTDGIEYFGDALMVISNYNEETERIEVVFFYN